MENNVHNTTNLSEDELPDLEQSVYITRSRIPQNKKRPRFVELQQTVPDVKDMSASRTSRSPHKPKYVVSSDEDSDFRPRKSPRNNKNKRNVSRKQAILDELKNSSESEKSFSSQASSAASHKKKGRGSKTVPVFVNDTDSDDEWLPDIGNSPKKTSFFSKPYEEGQSENTKLSSEIPSNVNSNKSGNSFVQSNTAQNSAPPRNLRTTRQTKLKVNNHKSRNQGLNSSATKSQPSNAGSKPTVFVNVGGVTYAAKNTSSSKPSSSNVGINKSNAATLKGKGKAASTAFTGSSIPLNLSKKTAQKDLPRIFPKTTASYASLKQMGAATVSNQIRDPIFGEQMKKAANTQYQLKNYTMAISLYTQAIQCVPGNAIYYGNRCAALMMVGNYTDALKDARTACLLDNGYIKGYIREAKCLLGLGDVLRAEATFIFAQQMAPNEKSIVDGIESCRKINEMEMLAEKAVDMKDFPNAIALLNQCLIDSPSCATFNVLKAEALCLQKKINQSRAVLLSLLKMQPMCVGGLYVRALCSYHEDKLDKSIADLNKAMKIDQTHIKSKVLYIKATNLLKNRAEGTKAFQLGQYSVAHKAYTRALEVDPENLAANATLYYNRAVLCQKLNKWNNAINDCSSALKMDVKHMFSLSLRAACYMTNNQFEEGVADYERLCRLYSSAENKKMLYNARAKLSDRLNRKRDYYKILGVPSTASAAEITSAYRKRAKIHHPDRHVGASPSKQNNEEAMFKEIGEAYNALTSK